MTSSECTRALGVTLAALVASAWFAVPARAQLEPRHVDLYNQATELYRRALRAPELSDQRADAAEQCLDLAVESFNIEPSRLAAWRAAACSYEAAEPLTAWVAFLAFEALEPGGVARWTHGSISEAELERVRDWRRGINHLVGGLRLTGAVAPTGWLQAAGPIPPPILVEPGRLRRIPFDGMVQLGDVLYARALVTVRAVLPEATAGAGPRESELRFPTLNAGIRDLDLSIPERLSSADVDRVIAELRPRLDGCGVSSGTVDAEFTIRGDGTVANVGGTSHALSGTRSAIGCVWGSLRAATFPRFRAGTIAVSVTIDFRASPPPEDDEVIPSPYQPTCRPDGASCGSPRDCCGGLCRSTRCWSCTAAGGRCSRTDDQCCVGTRCDPTGSCR